MSSSTTPFPIEYCNTQLVVNEMNLQQYSGDPTKYLIWQVPTSVNIINTFVNQANEMTTINFGDLRQSADRFALARQYATKKASLLLVDEMSINWVISGFPVTVGNISINRLAGYSQSRRTSKKPSNSAATGHIHQIV